MEGNALISPTVLASYAADAALAVDGVAALVDSARRHRGVRVSTDDGAVELEVHIAVEWGADASSVGAEVQSRVGEYLGRTAKPSSVGVEVVIDDVGPAPAH